MVQWFNSSPVFTSFLLGDHQHPAFRHASSAFWSHALGGPFSFRTTVEKQEIHMDTSILFGCKNSCFANFREIFCLTFAIKIFPAVLSFLLRVQLFLYQSPHAWRKGACKEPMFQQTPSNFPELNSLGHPTR